LSHLAQEREALVLLQGAREQVGLGQDLKTDANPDDRAPSFSKLGDRSHDRRKSSDRSWAQVVAVCEAPREHHRVERAERGGSVPNELGLSTKALERLN